jgi:hypothetical protein
MATIKRMALRQLLWTKKVQNNRRAKHGNKTTHQLLIKKGLNQI